MGAERPDERVVYVVDDDEAVRESLTALLEARSCTVRSFALARGFLAAAPTLRAGCLVADLRMPEMDGFELQRQLALRSLNFPLIVITGHGDVSLAVRAMQGGAIDFIEKPFAPEAILAGIEMAWARLTKTGAEDPIAAAAAARLGWLSPREREVLERLLAGLPNKSIACALAISPRTVEIHRARVMDKMAAKSLSALIRLSLAAGLQPQP